MEPGELPDTAVTVSASHLQQMRQRVSNLRRWVDHLVRRVRTLEGEGAILCELTHSQAQRIEHLEEGIAVRPSPNQQPTVSH